MTYRTLLVHLELDAKNAGLLELTADLASKFDANVIGIAACQPSKTLFDEGLSAGQRMIEDRAEISRALTVAEAEFRENLLGRVKNVEWRSRITYGSLASYIAEEARAADLIITRPTSGSGLLDDTRCVNVGVLALEAGRPILVVPHGVSSLTLNNTFVAWKDSRESRRAVADALPLLRLARNVTVLEAASSAAQSRAHNHVADVARWLAKHDIDAEAVTTVLNGDDATDLYDELIESGCDFLVAGAYGHSRLKEYVFGGVTRELLLSAEYCVLISH